MNSMKSLVVIFFMLCFSFVSQGQKRQTIQNAFEYSGSYTGDCMYNLSGGIKTGSAYLGMMSVGIGFDTEKANLWKGGNVFINAVNLHGTSPTDKFIGDSQVASNIDAGEHSYVQEFWYSQKINDLEFIVGLQDINVSFANSNVGALYLNSSFGILPTIANNFHVPIFPLTAPSFIVKWHINNSFSWNNAITGEHTDFDNNKYNLKWDFNRQTGLTFLSELRYNLNSNVDYPSFVKLGVFSHNHYNDDHSSINHESVNVVDTVYEPDNSFGMFVTSDLNLWQQDNKSLNLFLQAGYSPSDNSVTDFYFGTGVNSSGLFSSNGYDELGLALNFQHFNDGKSVNDYESVIELTYHYQLTDNFYVQPDFQYIINPSGISEELDNDLVCFIRFGLEF